MCCWNLLFGGHKRLEFGASEVEQIAHTNTQEVHATQGWLDNFAMIFVGATHPADKLVNLIASPLRDVISTMLSDVDSLKSDYGISVGTECLTFDHYHVVCSVDKLECFRDALVHHEPSACAACCVEESADCQNLKRRILVKGK